MEIEPETSKKAQNFLGRLPAPQNAIKTVFEIWRFHEFSERSTRYIAILVRRPGATKICSEKKNYKLESSTNSVKVD